MRSTVLLISMLIVSNTALADRHHQNSPSQNAPHAGQMDTDGILSPGEIRNPNIDYDRAQRHGEWHGDSRYDNPYNDRAAEDSRDERWRDDRWRDDRPHAGGGYGNGYGGGYADSRSIDDAIRYGEHSGRLSDRELRDIRDRQRAIDDKEHDFRRDGYLSERERDELESDRRKLQDNINHNLDDGERR